MKGWREGGRGGVVEGLVGRKCMRAYIIMWVLVGHSNAIFFRAMYHFLEGNWIQSACESESR